MVFPEYSRKRAAREKGIETEEGFRTKATYNVFTPL
jgi:hypothetical protein